MTNLKSLVLILALITPSTSLAMESKCRGEARLRSLNSDVATKMRFINQSRSTASIYWIDFKGRRILYQNLRPNQSYTQETYLTHPWVAISRNGRCLGVYKPKHGGTSVVLK